MSNYYRDFQASLFKFCGQLITDITSFAIATPSIIKWDAHADLNDIPNVDLIGPMEFSLVTNDGTYVMTTMIAASTHDDTNLERLDNIINFIHDRVQPDTTVPLVDALTGAPRSVGKIMDGVGVLPVFNTKTRPMKAITIQVGTGLSRGL